MGGNYGKNNTTLKDISFAPLTNLNCERNFGHLDASQRGRPHSSLHHHTSVILLKQTRINLRPWYSKLSVTERRKLWERARKRGSMLRKKHQSRDHKALMEMLPFRKVDPTVKPTTIQENLQPNQMIAVACVDTWYPGNKIKVKWNLIT